jgi:hypothetical protein
MDEKALGKNLTLNVLSEPLPDLLMDAVYSDEEEGV